MVPLWSDFAVLRANVELKHPRRSIVVFWSVILVSNFETLWPFTNISKNLSTLNSLSGPAPVSFTTPLLQECPQIVMEVSLLPARSMAFSAS